ncbi:MAG: HAMP domain-containing histidine kinase [Muribaculaceae bacterium]|nr:HAMP domain-containing histidine kinase [Muribaculaceae bacterium]
MRLVKSLFLAVLLGVAFMGHAAQIDQSVRDSIQRNLDRAVTPADSIRALYDMYDTALSKDRLAMAERLYQTALRHHNIDVQCDMLRTLSQIVKSDSLLDDVVRRAENMPPSPEQRETLTFVKMMKINAMTFKASEAECADMLFKELNSYPGDSESTLEEQILHLYSVCMYLGNDSRGSMLLSYLDRLGNIVRKLPHKFEGVRNYYFMNASRIYADNGAAEKSVAAAREWMSTMEHMKERHRKEGRKFTHADMSEYMACARLMSNYQYLAPGELESLYEAAQRVISRNGPAANFERVHRSIELFYSMATGDYANALPILKEALTNDKRTKSSQYNDFKMLMIAAEAMGDKEALITATRGYAESLEERLYAADRDRLNELQVVYNVNTLQKERDAMVKAQHEAKTRRHETIIRASVVAVIVLILVVLMMLRLYRRAKTLASKLENTNKELRDERDKLKRTQQNLIAARDKAHRAADIKTDFVNSMSREVSAPLTAIVEYSQFIVDNMDDSRRKYLEGFAEVVTLNAELLQNLINNALDVSSMERDELTLVQKPVSVQSMCHMAVETIRKRVKDGVELEFVNYGEPDVIVTTDPARVEQVLLNLLSNAAKFTNSGSIKLSYNMDMFEKTLSFAVTDTGIGIPEGKEAVIFDRFEKLDRHSQGSGLGLYICSMVAKLLGGTVKVDTSYTEGARFVFTIPSNPV